MTKPKTTLKHNKLLTVLLATFAISYLTVFMEWLFFLTKPSFMSTLNPSQTMSILLTASFAFSVPSMLAVLVLGLGGRLASGRSERFLSLPGLVPAILAACLALIVLDNFTYTIFRFGIISSTGLPRAAYACLFVLWIVYFHKIVMAVVDSPYTISVLAKTLFALVLIVSGVLLVSQTSRPALSRNDMQSEASTGSLPDIVLFGIDGVNAENMSVYGYARPTTPNLDSLADRALVLNNAFSNSGNTGGALISLLSGKLPTTTRVLYPPDILRGQAAYEHLPAILRKMGYTNIQISVPDFGDAYDRNLRDGFDLANFRPEASGPFAKSTAMLGLGSELYLADMISRRISDRLRHVFYIKAMDNPFETVTRPISAISEEYRFKALIDCFENLNGPLFVHVHMMGPHGPFFEPHKPFFSKGILQTQPWTRDFYDDAIRDTDRFFGRFHEYLVANHKLENTMIVLYSDHGMAWNSRNRIPLILWYPGGEHVGRIDRNAQLIDIAPTILHYLGVEIPAWMEGQSIPSGLTAGRRIFSADAASGFASTEDGRQWIVNREIYAPPFYQLGRLNLIICDRWFALDVKEFALTHGKVSGSTAHCHDAVIPTLKQVVNLFAQRLELDGYETSSLTDQVIATD